jgi:hypothetical protein
VTDRTDNFNRANGGLGANWTVMSDASNTGTLNIVSNQVKINTNGLDAASRWSADTFSGDHYAQCVATSITSPSSGIGPTIRNQLATTAKYELDVNTASQNLYYFDGTNWTSLTSNITGIVSGDLIRLEVVGTGLTSRVNGVSSLTVTDATLSGGAPGLHIFENTGDTVIVDDWLGGPIVFGRVQGGVHNNGASSSTTCAVTVSAVGSGHTICGLVSWDNTTNPGATVSVSDDKGNTYNVEAISTDTTNNQKTTAFSLTNITNAPTVFTATLSAANAFCSILVEEFSGVSRASSDERDGAAHGGQFQNSPGTGTDGITSGTFTTNTNGDLLWGCCTDNVLSPALASNGTGFSTGTQDSVDYTKQSEFKTQPTAGSGTAATFTQAVNDQRIAYLIALKADGAVAAANPPYQPHYQRAPILAQ